MRMCSRTTSPLPLTSHNGHREYCSLEKYIHGDVLDNVCHVKNNFLAAQVFINWTKILISSVCYILFSYHISSPPRSIYHFSPSDFSLTHSVCSSSAHSSFPPPLHSHMALSFFFFFCHMALEPPFHSNLCSNVIHSEKSCLPPFVK